MITNQVIARRVPWLHAAAILYFLSIISLPFHIRVLSYVIRWGSLPIGHAFGQTFHQLDGPIMQIGGPNAIVASILAYSALSVFEGMAGYWLWMLQKRGSSLAPVLLPIYLFFAIGWGVPYMLLLGVLKGITLALGWKSPRSALS